MKKFFTLLLVLTGMVSTAIAASETTIYYAVPASVVTDVSKSVELQMKYGSGDSEWFNPAATMSKTDKTYYGNYIYRCTVNLPHDGYYNMEFWYNGSKIKEVYAGSWNTNLHNGEMYDHNAGWRKYNYDKTVTIHALKKDGWTDVYICNEFNDYDSHWDTEVTFPGTIGTQSTINGNWYDYTITGRPCTRVVTSNGYDGAGNRSGNCEIGDAEEYWISYDGSTTTCESTPPASYNYTRSITDGKFGTICLPYNATISGATVYEISSKIMDGETFKGVNLTEVTGNAIVAGGAYIFKGTSSTLTATLSGNFDPSATATGAGLVGNLSSTPTVLNGSEDPAVYVLSNNKICKVVTGGTGVTVNQYRAYINPSTLVAGARSTKFLDCEDETTGIEAVNVNTENTNGTLEYYNLSGQRVANPTKGLYIVSGKKVIIK